jgi:hypothetical protein
MQDLTIETEYVCKQTAARETAFRTIVSNTGCTSVGEVLITRRISEVAACCSSASASFSSKSARGSRMRLLRVLTFVLVERRRPARVGLFAPLRAKITSSAQSLALSGRPAKDRASILTEPHDEHASPHSITSSARASSVGGIVRPSALAVLRLVNSSTFVTCWTGRSAGFSP